MSEVPELVRLEYANGRRTLVIEADLEHGWERREATYGFFAMRRVPLVAPRDRNTDQYRLWEARLSNIHDRENNQFVRIEQRITDHLSIRSQLSFMTKPNTFEERAARPPAQTESADFEHLRLRYSPGLLRAEVDFLEHPWMLTAENPRRPHIHLDKQLFFRTAPDLSALSYHLQILLVFHGFGTPRPPPVEREYGDGGALPGGLPGTNRGH